MHLFRVFAACLIAVPAVAQPLSRNPPSVTFAHIDLNSADPDAAVAFWREIIGAESYRRESLNGVGMIGAQIVFTRKAPAGPSVGSAIDYLDIRVPDLQQFVERLAKTAFKSFRPNPGDDVLMIDGPDGVRIELTQDSSMYAPLEFGYIHFRTPEPTDTQTWYGKYFGASPNSDGALQSSRLSGATLTFSKADAVLPTTGRAIDHISFEVKEFQRFCKVLSDDGIQLNPSLQSMPQARGSSVFLTDPWGTRIELIEAAAR